MPTGCLWGLLRRCLVGGERVEFISVVSSMDLSVTGLTSSILETVCDDIMSFSSFLLIFFLPPSVSLSPSFSLSLSPSLFPSLSDSNGGDFNDISKRPENSFTDQLLGYTVESSAQHITVSNFDDRGN